MGLSVKGDVVVVPFPFSDLSAVKRRPALVIATLTGDDLILCQITSQAFTDHYALSLQSMDFESGGLRSASHIRPNRLFTAEQSLVLYRAGVLRAAKMQAVVERLIDILKNWLYYHVTFAYSSCAVGLKSSARHCQVCRCGLKWSDPR